ncbi:uncharacterized protein K452DRAFT_311139 [Aplosporella prunicola CBS 121167]|uniref:Sorting nexin MVP1 n=1 Tax=Aplosporella prunicola CBS 121167 TaxID=1176127 RepID=A0A6A6B771_9PEZI|nr:uncharacterized protein K452DRAFT_311139 [Aplosporella prunicola CBS 121167]KAF2138651.1 hypothetical protein K452DRAFT_311139 [Aplosporella prunicola CBS 121167]
MSLFGTSPDNDRPRSALFADDLASAGSESPPRSVSRLANTTTSSVAGTTLFADDDDPGASSPWALPTPRQRTSNLQALLPAGAAVPSSYGAAFEAVMAAGARFGGGAGLTGVRRVLSASGLAPDEQRQVLDLVVPEGRLESGLGRAEFNVLCALVGLAREGEDVSLDGVDARRDEDEEEQVANVLPAADLPEPHLDVALLREPVDDDNNNNNNNDYLAPPPPPSGMATTPPVGADATGTLKHAPITPTTRKTSFGLDADPWNSPDLHKGHTHRVEQANATLSGANGHHSVGSVNARPAGAVSATDDRPEDAAWGGGGFGAGTTTSSSGVFGAPVGNAVMVGESGMAAAAVAGGEGGDGAVANAASPDADLVGLGRVLGGDPLSESTTTGPDEVVTVAVIPEKEGIFLFQHRNYQVTSVRRNAKVVRRYSDFVWLLDCLHKRYPFRQLPLLPPKRVSINGNYIATDASFVEKRRRGLARFANALVRHPVLSQEQLVIMFLTVPTELAAWRKQAQLNLQDEFAGQTTLPPGLEDALSPQLNELFERVRAGVKKSAETYIALCTLVERLAKRNEAMAADHMRASLALQTLASSSAATYAAEPADVAALNAGLGATARQLGGAQSLLEDEARAWDEGVLEDLKRQRDGLVALRELFERRDRLDRDNIPALEKKIKSAEGKLDALAKKPAELVKPGERERVEESIVRDKQAIVAAHARSVLVKQALRDELRWARQGQLHVARWVQDWTAERVKYAELQADGWRVLGEELEGVLGGGA